MLHLDAIRKGIINVLGTCDIKSWGSPLNNTTDLLDYEKLCLIMHGKIETALALNFEVGCRNVVGKGQFRLTFHFLFTFWTDFFYL